MNRFNTIEEALEDLRAGKIILVTDDEDRENEGDMICAAQFATTENVNLMASVAKGLICMPMSENSAGSCKYRRWSARTPTTTRQPSLFPSTTWTPLPAYRLRSGDSLPEPASTMMRSLRISEGRGICSH